MLDREKVIKGLETCYCPPAKCEDCPYYDIENCNDALCLDALSLLKEQDNCENCAIAIEDRQLVVRCKDCKHLFDGEHTKNCCDALMEKTGWLKEISVSPDWFCADGERQGDDG